MGYTTKFKGRLDFTKELTAKQLAYLNTILGEDIRDHKDWPQLNAAGHQLYHIDLELTEDFGGIQWSGTEKTSDMTDLVNVVTGLMRTKWPDFGMAGELLAQGDEFDDVWVLHVKDDGWAVKRKVSLKFKKVTCPNCNEECDHVICPHCEEKFGLPQE